MRSVGIDLAVQPTATGVAVIDWSDDGGGMATLGRSGDDAAIIEMLLDDGIDVIGLDVPLGWPVAFVDATLARRHGEQISASTWSEFYERARLRATDRWLRSSSASASPISVSMDKIGATAMRAAWLLSRAEQAGLDVDRSGVTGRIVEVYPAAALKHWGLAHKGYKGRNLDAMRSLAADVIGRARLTVDAEVSNDHELDALVSGIVARLARTGSTQAVPDEHLALARVEGWIHIPSGSLGEDQ